MSGWRDVLWRFPSAMMAWRNLRRNAIRSALATLGIVIGVVAIASLGMVGAAIQYSTTENLGSLTNQVTVTAGPDHPEGTITEGDVRALERLAVGEAVVPQRTDRAILEGNGTDRAVDVVGVTRASALYEVTEGEVPDRLQSGALVSQGLADALALGIGDPVVYDGASYRVRGVMEPQGFGGGPGGGETLVLPIDAVDTGTGYDSVTVVAVEGAAAEAYADRVEETLNDRRERLRVTTQADLQESIREFTSTLNLALLGIGSISLVVASVAILNIMLMSTIERRGEIGVLRAVGIRRSEVLRMIITEAGLLGVLGALVGGLVSLGAGLGINELLFGDPMLVFTWNSAQFLLLAIGFGVGASLVSGLYPAWKAANDPPVEALRS